MHNYRVYVSGSFVVQAADEDTAWEKALDMIPYDYEVENIEKEDYDPDEI